VNSFEDFFVFVFVLDIVATDAAMPPPACVTASHPIFPQPCHPSPEGEFETRYSNKGAGGEAGS
jgi:hypothetical protein